MAPMPPMVHFVVTSEADVRTLLAELDRQAPPVVHRTVLPQLLTAAAELERHGGGAAALRLSREDAAIFRAWLEAARRRQVQAGHPTVGDAFARVQQSEQ
jgi:hypothetical protein